MTGLHGLTRVRGQHGLWHRNPVGMLGLLVLALSLVCLLAGGCAGEPPLDVWLITMDTTRADHLGCYGHDGIETPAIDRLAAEGVLYEQALTVVPITLPAHTSIFSSTYPLHHGVRENGGFYVPEELDTLPELLSAAGYDTAAFIGAFPLDSQTGIDRGFDVYDDDFGPKTDKHPRLRHFYDERPAAEVARSAMSWLDGRGERPLFLWTHFFDPHQPLEPVPPFAQRYPTAPYDAEIAAVDAALGRLIAKLEATGRLDRTLIVLTADHGEGLGDHGEETHALLLHSATLHVPLVVRDPRAPKSHRGRRVPSTVSTLDILPTILGKLGLPVPAVAQGLALPIEEAAATPRRELYAETLYGHLLYGWSPLERLTFEGRALIHGPQDRLFELRSDPGEDDNLAGEQAQVTLAMRQRLERVHSELAAEGRGFSTGAASPETRARLAALGYVGAGSAGAVTGDARVDSALPDPHDQLPAFALFNEAINNFGSDRFAFALALLERALPMDARNPSLRQYLAQSLLGLEQFDRARAELEQLLDLSPDHVGALLLLAELAARGNDGALALQYLARAVELDPANRASALALAYRYDDLGRPADAEAAYRRLLSEQPTDAEARNGLATLVYRQGRADEAMELLTAVLADRPYYPPAHLNLAVIEFDRGNPEEARRLARRALALRPNYPRAQELLALLDAG